VRGLTGLSRTPQDFDYCPCSRTPELQFVGRLTALNSVLNIIKVLPNSIDCPVTVPVDEASSGDPGNTVHGVRIGAESLRQVKLTIMHGEDRGSAEHIPWTDHGLGCPTDPWNALMQLAEACRPD
jgi:hypothetical protein